MTTNIDPAYREYLEHQRELRAATDAEHKAAQYRPDGTVMRALRFTTYIVVIITCIVLIAAVIDVYQFIGNLREALDTFSNNINPEGILGN